MSEFLTKAFGGIIRSISREIGYYRSTPSVATLILTYKCTSRCKTCTIWKRPIMNFKELGLSEWKYIVDQLYRNSILNLEIFGGDVFLRKDILMPLIRYIKNNGMIIHLPTNANLLDQETVSELVNSGVDYIYISIDGVGSRQDEVRGVNGTFNRVSKALAYINKTRFGKDNPKLICNTTVSNLNVDSLEAIAKFTFENHFNEIHFEYAGEFKEEHIESSKINGIRPNPFYIMQGKSVLLSKEGAIQLRRILKIIRKKYANTRLGVTTTNIDTLTLKDIYQGTINNKKCYMIRNEVDIDPYGNVTSCFCFNNFYLGNLTKDDLKDIWNGKKHLQFIEMQKKGEIDLCNHCIIGVERNHSFIRDLYRIYFTALQNRYFRFLAKK